MILPEDRLLSMSAEVLVSTRAVSVLADPTRAAILRLILDADEQRVLVGETARLLQLRQPTVSHHMKKLLDEGIVTRQPHGRVTWYAIAPIHRERVEALLSAARPAPAPADISRVVTDLMIRFDDALSREAIEGYVADAHTELSASTPPHLLTSRTATFAIERIQTALDRPRSNHVPHVLFVCAQNAGRSQIAASVLRRLAGDTVRVHTAGSTPADDVRASIVAVLDEVGLSLDGEFPKPLTADILAAADVVVTMGCGELCDLPAHATHLEWEIPDPVGLPLLQLRHIRDDIDRRVRDMLPLLNI